MRRLILLPLAIAALARPCRAADAPGPLADLKPCPAFQASVETLAEVSDASGSLRISLPPGAQPDTGERFIHGGQSWVASGAAIRLSFGHWSPDSFEPTPGETRCRANIGGMDALVIESGGPTTSSVKAWYVASGKPHDAVLAVSGPKERRRTFLAIVNSLRRAGKG